MHKCIIIRHGCGIYTRGYAYKIGVATGAVGAPAPLGVEKIMRNLQRKLVIARQAEQASNHQLNIRNGPRQGDTASHSQNSN